MSPDSCPVVISADESRSLEHYRPGILSALDQFLSGAQYVVPRASFDELLERYPPKPAPKIKGLGDIVHAVAQPIAQAIGLEECGSCDARRTWLNDHFPL
jgi:hypothetical protein